MSTPEPTPVAASTAKGSIATTRAQLEETLNAIEDKLNVPKRLGKVGRKAQAAYEENPVPWIIGATAAVIVVGGLIAWAIFSDD